jgi:para-nitrobenzyl esterase
LRTIQLADLKTAQKLAPVWMYRFDWATPIMGGVVQTPHMLEIPFVFDNAAEDFCLPMTGGGSAAADLAARMSGAWVAFAKTGNPDSGGIPHWPAYEVPERFAMLFDNKCRVVKDPSGDDWRALDEFKQLSE